MRAFGPYGARASVDFEPLADVGLFVVSGPTGAGKSTIFDAMCFALYGSLSGVRASHNDVRSHYADPHDKCSVELVFDAQGQRWRVTRQPSQTVQKRRGAGTTNQPATANLEHWDGEAWQPDTTKVRDVTARCRDLVGLSLEQFERVVLLPQGKFAEVLNARTSERSELLRTLFGSEVFDRAADILGEQAKEGERALQGVNEQRSSFHQRAVDAIERAGAALADLPDELCLFDDQVLVPSVERQLSLLDAPLEDEPARSADDVVPADDLESLVAGPVGRFRNVVDQRRQEAEAARAARDRAETQLRAIDQRSETIRLLAVLESRTEEMAELAAQATTARSLLGLEPALAERRERQQHVERSVAAMSSQWAEASALVETALPNVDAVADVSQQATAMAVAALLDRVAAKSASLDAATEQTRRLNQLQKERAAVAERLSHLGALEERAHVEAQASAVELAGLAEEAQDLQEVVSDRAKIADELTGIDHLLKLRSKADAVAAELARLVERRTSIEATTAAAEQSINLADTEIAALSVIVHDRPARQVARTQAVRRCQRKAELQEATTEMDKATASAESATKAADQAFAAFVRQTAPRLAADLTDDEPCPVCGSCEHPAPASAADNIDGGASTDAASVERASAAAAAAEAELARWRTTVANLIEDDPELATKSQSDLDAVAEVASTELAAADEALAHRDTLLENRTTLQSQLLEAQTAVREASTEVAGLQLTLSEIEGALGDASAQTRRQLEAEQTRLQRALRRAEEAAERLETITIRSATITTAAAEADRLARQRAVDQATATERIEQVDASVVAARDVLDAVLDGQELSVQQHRVQSLRGALTAWQEQSMLLARFEAALESSRAATTAIVTAAGFETETAALAAALPASNLEQNEAMHGRWSHELAAHRAALAALEVHDLPDERPDLEHLTAHAIQTAEVHRDVAEILQGVEHAVQSASSDLAEVAALDAAFAERRARHETLQRVAHVVRGQNSRRLSLENWVLSVYLHDVVEHANLHLATMSNGRYRLAVQDAPSSQVGQHGLDLVVDDAHTGRVRSSMSLSGGETFQASLALALGLADVVMLGRAGLHLDALFVDEGFGSLDADAIDQAITVLDGLRSRGSMVGVITHVEALKNALPVAIDVQPRRDLRGSEIRQVA